MNEEQVDVSGLAEAMTSMPAVQAEDAEPIAPAGAVDDSSSAGEDYGFDEEEPRIRERHKKPAFDPELEGLKDEIDVAQGKANARISDIAKDDFEKFVVTVDWDSNRVCIRSGGRLMLDSIVSGSHSNIMQKVNRAMKRAIDSCKPSGQTEPEEVAEIVEAPNAVHSEKPAKTAFKKKQEFDHVGLEEFKPMVSDLLDRFNKDLARYHLPWRQISQWTFSAEYDGDSVSVKSGDREICHGVLRGKDFAGLYKKVRAIVRSEFESTKSERPDARNQPAAAAQKVVKPAVDFWNEVESFVKEANSKLDSSSQLVLEKDTAGVYITSGGIAVSSVPRINKEKSLAKIKADVTDWIGYVKGVVDRRNEDDRLAEKLSADCDGDESAFEAVKAQCGEDVARKKLQMCDETIRASIVGAATGAVNSVNAMLDIRFTGEVADLLGGRDEVKLRVRGFTRGLVVSYGADEEGKWKACLVTRFPSVANNNTISESVAFVRDAIAKIGESRMKHFDKVSKEFEASKKLKSIAERLDAANAELKAMAM